MSDVCADKKTASAKEASKWSMIVAAIWIAGFTIIKAVGLVTITVEEIILSGFAIAACFTPVYFSIIMDKFKDMKLGKE